MEGRAIETCHDYIFRTLLALEGACGFVRSLHTISTTEQGMSCLGIIMCMREKEREGEGRERVSERSREREREREKER